MKTHYDVLGVPFGADHATIRAAYRKALKTYHPDLHDGDATAELLSKRIIDAHAVLKDPEQRALYDEYLLHHRQQRGRLIAITVLSAGLACGGSLMFFSLSRGPGATEIASSSRLPPAADSTGEPAAETNRVAQTASPLVTAALPPSEMEDVRPSTVVPTPPRHIADAKGPSAPVAPSAGETKALPPLTVPPAPPETVAKAESPSVPAAPPPSEMDAQPSVAIVPTPPRDIAAAESPPAPAPSETAAVPPANVMPTPPLDVAAAESPPVPAAPPLSETHDAPSSATVVPSPPNGLAQPASAVAAITPPEKSTPGTQPETAWADIEKTGSAEEVLKFIQGHPTAPGIAAAERSLEELIETSDDIASLEALRAVATGPIVAKLQERLDQLASSEEVIASAVPEQSGQAPPSEGLPHTVMAPAPDVGSPQQEETAEQTADITPRDPKIHLRKGLALLKAGDNDRAIDAFDKAIRLDSGSAEYRLQRAAAWENKGDLDKALADYDAAIRLDQTNIGSFHARGLLWRRRGNAERALADLDRAIRMSFSDAEIYRDRGMVWYEMGRYNRAIADFSRAITLNPNFASAYLSRGQAFQKNGDMVTAAINFDKAARRDPSIRKTHRDLFRGLSENGEPTEKAPQASR